MDFKNSQRNCVKLISVTSLSSIFAATLTRILSANFRGLLELGWFHPAVQCNTRVIVTFLAWCRTPKNEDQLQKASASSSGQLVVVARSFLCYSFVGPRGWSRVQLWCIAASIDGVFWREQGEGRLVKLKATCCVQHFHVVLVLILVRGLSGVLFGL